MEGNVLAVDFENKKLLKETQHKSETKTNKHYLNHIKVCDGDVTLFTTKKSGGIWQFRHWSVKDDEYIRFSLRTRDLESAKHKAQIEYAKILVKKEEGKALRSPTIYNAVQQYLDYRWAEDVGNNRITEGRFGTVKTTMNHFKNFVNAEYKLNTLNKGALAKYQTYRRAKNITDVTIRNEQATINHFCNWAYTKGLHDTDKFLFPIIKVSGDDREKTKRATFTIEEYGRLTKWLRTYVSKTKLKEDKCDEGNAHTRQLFRHFVLIMANTMMRNGEFYSVKWNQIKTFTDKKSGKRLVEISIKGIDSKVGKSRVFIARGGEHFDRWKQLSRYTDKNDYVLTDWNGKGWNGHNRRALDWHWHKMMNECEIADVKERKVQIYSLRHFGITQRLQNGVTNLTQFALDCGTSVGHITQTYYHTSREASLENAIMRKE